MKIAILGSGSSGNSIYIESAKSKILIDAGFSGKVIKEKMEKIGKNLDDIKALLVTHEHGDHILGAGILVRRHKMPIYITRESYLAGEKKLGNIEDIFNTGSNDIYVVKSELGKQILLPAISDVVKNIDMENKKMVVHLISGLI